VTDADPFRMRGLAHPVRLRMLGLLRTEGPATASTLARRLELNTGATSYHLRQLAEHGFVTEVPGRGVRRERWWQAAQANTDVPNDVASGTEAGAAFLTSLAELWSANIRRAIDAGPALPPAWQPVQEFSDYMFRLTADEARALATEVHTVLRRYQTVGSEAVRPPSPGAATVTFQFQLFPDADTVGSDADAGLASGAGADGGGGGRDRAGRGGADAGGDAS